MIASEDLIRAYAYCSNHGRDLAADQDCGCYRCLARFRSSAITHWLPDRHDQTALCPHCGSDSVLGASSGFPIEAEFLQAMKRFWDLDQRTGA
jgi:hypothetical protein